MAATDIEKLIVTLEARTKAYESALAKAQGTTVTRLKAMEREAQGFAARFDKKLGAIGGNLKAGLAGFAVGTLAAAAAGLAAFAKSAITEAAAIGDLSDKIGISSDKLQELQYGAVQANLSFEELGAGLLKFSKSLGEAQNGQGELLKTLKANGFDQAQIKALSYSEALDVVADLVRNAKNEQDAYQIILDSFGKSGAPFLEFLSKGSGGLIKFGIDATEAGAKIDDALIKTAQELDDRWAALMLSMKRNTQREVLQILAAFESLGKTFSTGTEAGLVRGAVRPPPQLTGTDSPSELFGFPKKPAPTTVLPDPEAIAREKTARLAAADAALKQADAIQKVIEGLQFEQKQLLASDLQQEINTELRKAGVAATSAQGQAITKLVTANFNIARSQEAAITAGEAWIEQQEKLKQAAQELADEINSSFKDGIVGFKDDLLNGVSAVDALSNALDGLLQKLTDLLLNQALDSLFTSGGTSGGFNLASLFGGGTGAAPGLYAQGGRIPAGKLGIAGEAGPELLMGPGTVVPFKRGNGNGGSNVIIKNFPGMGARESRSPNGDVTIEIVRDVIAADVASRNSKIGRALDMSRGARIPAKVR